MGIILIMGLGMIVGKWVFPEKIKKWNEKAQLACTLMIIFSMGIMLGEKENFLKDLPRLGIRSFIFFAVPTVLSIIVVYFLTKHFMDHPGGRHSGEAEPVTGEEKEEGRKGEKRFGMVKLALAALAAGIAMGAAGLWKGLTGLITSNTERILYCLMFSVGISVGLQEGIFNRIRRYHIRILIIPLGTIAASALGGVICAIMTGYPLNQSVSIASGLGWYSLSGAMLSELGGAELGSIAFLSNLLREIFSFFLIPFLALKLNYFACIASAGATSEDTTLPMMIKYTDGEAVVLSVLNGIICSAAVPVLISFFYQILP